MAGLSITHAKRMLVNTCMHSSDFVTNIATEIFFTNHLTVLSSMVARFIIMIQKPRSSKNQCYRLKIEGCLPIHNSQLQ